MRHPLWIINSALCLLLIGSIGFMLISHQDNPTWAPLEPIVSVKPTQKKNIEINISKIYEYDLFDTYQKPSKVSETQKHIAPFPQPPQPYQVYIPAEPKPQFLEPLKIVLKGIIMVSNDDSKNRVIIADAATGKEIIIKIGNSVEDAQLIKIFNKKVIFLRSNGQQEVLYLREKDAQDDPMYAVNAVGFKGIALRRADGSFVINKKLFTERVASLAQFIDLLELTTVYKMGEAIGCRIGKINSSSLGYQLGFEPDDIVIIVDQIPTDNAHNRLAIYKKIMRLQTHDTIRVLLQRNHKNIEINYMIVEDIKDQATALGRPLPGVPVLAPVAQIDKQAEILQQHHKFAPTLQEIREQERRNMLEKGRLLSQQRTADNVSKY